MSIRSEFDEKDFVKLENPLGVSAINLLNEEHDQLMRQARDILNYMREKDISLPDFYKNEPDKIIVTPEKENSQEICRIEYIAASSKKIKDNIVEPIAVLIKNLMGFSFCLFKDKCNLKNPGGGAFPPHQDISAYSHFKPEFYITAAVMLDNSTIENGCLEMACEYKNNLDENTILFSNQFGTYPIFDYHHGGSKNGDIYEEISSNFNWQFIEANRGDIILFNSYIPHRSQVNFSKNKRRNLFFTFNLESEGDHYQEYYNLKRLDFENPIFHVSTPTLHDDRSIKHPFGFVKSEREKRK